MRLILSILMIVILAGILSGCAVAFNVAIGNKTGGALFPELAAPALKVCKPGI